MRYRFNNVLFAALNDSPNPPPQLADAVEFARRTDASMTLFDSIAPMSRVQRTLRFGDNPVGDFDFVGAARGEQLRGWAEEYRPRLRMGYTVGTGRRSAAINRRVADAHHDLVVVAPNGNVDDFSVVRRLIRTVPCPLLVLKGPMLNGNVIAAVDPDDDLALNIMIASSAQGLASAGQRSMHLVHAYEPHGVRMLLAVDLTDLTSARIDAFVDKARDVHCAALSELADRIGLDSGVASHVDVGTPLDVIACSAVELEASLVVVGAGGHSGMPAMLIGHTAERIVTTIAESTLIVKAPGFVPAADDDDWFSSGALRAMAPAIA